MVSFRWKKGILTQVIFPGAHYSAHCSWKWWLIIWRLILRFFPLQAGFKTSLSILMWPSSVPGKALLLHWGKLSDSTGRRDIETWQRQTSNPEAYLILNYLQAKRNQFSKVMANLFSCPLKYSSILCFQHTVRTFSKQHKYKSVLIFITELFACSDQGQWWYCSDSLL